jgi:hypothetical protein
LGLTQLYYQALYHAREASMCWRLVARRLGFYMDLRNYIDKILRKNAGAWAEMRAEEGRKTKRKLIKEL